MKSTPESKQAEPNQATGQGEGKPESKVKSKKGLKVFLLVLLTLFLLGLVTFAGYKYRESKKEDSKKTEESTSIEKDTPEPVVDESGKVSPISGEYEVDLPESWVSGTCPDNPDILFLAPNTDLLGKCQTESFGMVSVDSNQGDIRKSEEYYTSDDYFGSAAYSPETVDSLPGYRVSYSVATETELGYPPVGTLQYIFNLYDSAADRTYSIAYQELPGDPDHQSKFIEIAESFRRL